MKKMVILFIFSMLILMVTQLPAHAVLFGFENISANNVNNAAFGEAQLSVDVTDTGSGQVLFTFLNAGPEASSITDIYFDDNDSTPLLSGIAQLIDNDDGVGGDAGVDYSIGANPSNLPSGNDAFPSFEASSGMTADSDPPRQTNGINPGEFLGVILNLQSGLTFADALAYLDDGSLRIGIHVQGFANGGSESFINNGGGTTPVPEPATMLLLASGLLGLAGYSRKKLKG